MIQKTELHKFIQKINPLAFSKYLINTGWKSLPIKRNDIRILQKNVNTQMFQVIIPMDKILSDYDNAMYEAIERVAFVSRQTIEEIVLFLLNPNADILKIRLIRKDVEAGSIFIDEAIALYENAKKMITATAQDIVDPKNYHKGRTSEAVSNFINNCRFGQTEVGSYVISVVCPFASIDADKYKQLSLFSPEDDCSNSFTRQVTNKIMTNIALIKDNIDKNKIEHLTNNHNDNIISSNFYEALVGMNLALDDTNVEFSAQWSPTVQNNRCDISKITISHNYYEPVSEIISRIRKDISSHEKVCGRVSRLCAIPDSDERKDGMAIISYLDKDNKKKTVRIVLSKPDYNKAIEAHKNGCYVEAIGNIVTQGSVSKMTEYNVFNVL